MVENFTVPRVTNPLSISGFHPLRFFSKLGATEKNVAFFTSGTWTVTAWNPESTMIGNDASVFDQLKKLPYKKSKLPFSGGAIGYCSYDLGCILQGVKSRHRSALPLAVFHRYDNAVLWNGKDVIVIGDDSFMSDVRHIHSRPFVDHALPPVVWESALKKSSYRKKFLKVMRGIRNGDFYQLNLSYPFFAKEAADHRKLFAAYAEMHPAPCASYFEHDRTAIMSLSPERFVTIENGVITTRPIKGTCSRGKTPVEDKRLSEALLANPKEAAELNMITDLLRNDIGKVSKTGSVKVIEPRSLQKNPSVWHTYSVIRGTLEKNLHPVDAFSSMFPGGSITGCPKVAAMKEIDQREDSARGAYCGSMLMISNSGFLDSTMLIRTIVSHKNQLSLGVGGGIVADSDCDSEYDETLKKAQPFLSFSDVLKPRYFRGRREIKANAAITALFNAANPDSSGVFETMLVKDGVIRDLSAHCLKLKHASTLLGFKILPTSVLAANLKAAVKLTSAPIFRVKIVSTSHDILIETRPLRIDPAVVAAGMSVTVVPLDRTLPSAKMLPYSREYAAHEKAIRKGFHEALIRRSDGSISEGGFSNAFFVKSKTLWTVDSNMLPGITRNTVLHLAKKLRIPVRFVALQEQDIQYADEIFMTGSLSGIMPVVRLENKNVGKGMPGKLTKRLMKAFEAEHA